MVTKKSVAMLVALASIGLSSFAMDQTCGSQVKELYAELLRVQGTDSPISISSAMKVGHTSIDAQSYRVMSQKAFNANLALFTNIFQVATNARTGIMVQYKNLILNPTESFLMMFLDFQHLQVIAYMQNVYGHGQPFVFDPTTGGILQTGGSSEYHAQLGSYINQQGDSLQITRYGLLNGIIDALISLETDPTILSNQNYSLLCKTLKNELIKAIVTASRQKLILFEKNMQSSVNITSNLMKVKSLSNAVDQLGKVFQ